MPLLKGTRQATSKLTPVADPKKAPQTTHHPEEKVEFMVKDYVDRNKLKALLAELFPGKWSAINQGDYWKVQAPRELTETEYESLQSTSSAAAVDSDQKAKNTGG